MRQKMVEWISDSATLGIIYDLDYDYYNDKTFKYFVHMRFAHKGARSMLALAIIKLYF